MQAVLQIKGKQYLVAPGAVIRVDAHDAEQGSTITLDQVKFVDTGKSTAKLVATATVVEHGLGKKIRVFKHHAKKRYRRTAGHRQAYTTLRIEKIESAA